MAIDMAVKKLKKLIESNPQNKSRLAAALDLTSTTTIDKWLKSEEIPHLKQLAVMDAIKTLEKKK